MTNTVPSAADGGDVRAIGGSPIGPFWDIWVRLFHWSLVLAVGFQLLSALTGFAFLDWHRIVGEVVLALVVFRLSWGVVGSPNARLSALFAGPAVVLVHLRELLHRNVPAERGHNALGGWAVLAMLLLIGVQAATGLYIADEDELLEGALYGDVAGDTSDLLWRIHTINANLIETIVILHIAMIAIYRLWARRDLLTPMISGRRDRARVASVAGAGTSAGRAGPPPGRQVGVLWKGVLCAAIALLGVGWLTGWF